MILIRGIRGATRAANNTRDDILSATEELLNEMTVVNEIDLESIASIFLTTTPDLNPSSRLTSRARWVGTRCPYSVPVKSMCLMA